MLVLSPSGVFAQEEAPEKTEEQPEKKKDEAKKLPELPLPTPGGGQEDKLLKLIKELEMSLTQVEELLFEASTQGAGELQEEILEKLDKLLNDAGQGQRNVMSAIDELIKNAPRSGGGGGGSSRDKKQSQKQRQQEQQREQEAKRQQQQQQSEQKDQSAKEDNSQQEERGGDRKEANQKPKDKTGDPNSRPDLVERWGNLPPMLKDRISSREFSSFPPAYREKLKKYYKRLNDDDR